MSESAELEPWQQRALEAVVNGKGRGTLQVTGRGTGKSMFSAHALKRLMDDLNNRPVEALIVTEGKVYGARYYCVEPVGGSWADMELWCADTFGETSSLWHETKALTPEPLKRWYMNNRKFWFREEKDRDWFVIRWNS